MKKILLIISCICLTLAGRAASNLPSVTGKVKGFGNDAVFVYTVAFSNPDLRTLDTVQARKGSFQFTNNCGEPSACVIFTRGCYRLRPNGRTAISESKQMMLFLFPGASVRIEGQLEAEGLRYTVLGDPFNEKFSQRRNHDLPDMKACYRMESRLDSLMYRKAPASEFQPVEQEWKRIRQNLLLSNLKYVSEHPDDDLSGYYLTNAPMDLFYSLVDSLSPSVRFGIFRNTLDRLENIYSTRKNTSRAQTSVVEGKPAPNFTLRSLDGSPVSLTSFKGSLVVLDFWGSWCTWCIKGMPDMKACMEKYRDKVVFLHINVRDEYDVWKKTVSDLQLGGIHVRNLTDVDLPLLYGVSGYPTKFILDRNGIILARIVGEDPAFYSFLDDLMKR